MSEYFKSNDFQSWKPIICMFGKVNSGKSLLFNKLIGENFSKVSNYAGHTTDFPSYSFKDVAYLVDTPGILDINKDISNSTFEYIDKHADIILFVINGAEGPTKDILDAYESLKSMEKTIIFVANKVDILSGKEIQILLDQCNIVFKQEVTPVSAKNENHLQELKEQLIILSIDYEKEAPPVESIFDYSTFSDNSTRLKGGIATTIGIGVTGLVIKSLFNRN